ncbi:hypothetical protein J1TS5_40930 [Paenibacillus macerans]|uniref:hypothetical protein n=1 Tax=Paenibacillus macerans TaxID=44252 RepID=UPI001B07DAE4|nr:hypothetical protein [Paenibacillus macerans]GIP11923.1 hypothetical protein J1TS5_40930 [Paenibacillus macerans]
MEYFIVELDRRLNSIGGAITFPETVLKGFEYANPQETAYVSSGQEIEYSCFIERPVLLFSEDFRRVITSFEPDLEHKTVVVMDLKRHIQVPYSLMNFKEIPCLLQNSTTAKIGEFVIDESRVPGLKIFKIPYYRSSLLVVRLDVAEGLLRKSLRGLKLRRILSVEGEFK